MGKGINRRELLKRGAIAGGALWATPIMHSVGIAQTDGEDTSPVCRVTLEVSPQYCRFGRYTYHDLYWCVTGCTCEGGLLLGKYNGSSISRSPISVGADGCGRLELGAGLTGGTFTLWVECHDAAGAVLARSTYVDVTWGPSSDCEAP